MTKLDKIFATVVLTWMALIITFAIINTMAWPDSIHNPANDAYVVEVAFNLDIEPWQVTQQQFNDRYVLK